MPAYRLRFKLSLSTETYLAYYKGKANSIQVRSLDNKKIRFPANAIRNFLTHDGVHGLFEIQFDECNKLVEIEKISL
ncbi:MAG: DUF2835 domain-containing protein [Proteobacteria bacterium]|nr:DUF2835 family protein [Pseudomonadota bacterium]NOG61170.1 DUF2835 domain-containing protein [Pseudomonadota bacterium]